MATIKEFLVKQKIGNGYYYVTIPSRSDVISGANKDRISNATDKSILNGVTTQSTSSQVTNNASAYYVMNSDGRIGEFVDILGRIEDTAPTTDAGYRLKIKLDLKKLYEYCEGDVTRSGMFSKQGDSKLKIKLGEYPSKVCSQNIVAELNSIYNTTDKDKMQYQFVRMENSTPIYAPSIEYKGSRYVKIESKAKNNCILSDKTITKSGQKDYWVKVTPIIWTVVNNEEVSKVLNGIKSDEGVEVALISDDILIEAMPFSEEWEKSSIRDYLNGITGNFQSSFLDEAGFDKIMRVKESQSENPYRFKFDDLDNDELLAECVKSRTSVYLHGVSGIGKSTRVLNLDPDAVFISLTNGMDPVEVKGGYNKYTKEQDPPIWYKNLKEICDAEPDKIHILFIDELGNVRPPVQSLVYSIVLDRQTADGLWKLPDNCCVVAAGNEQLDASAAFPITGPLFRRLCHIYYELDTEDFLKWATQIDKDGQPKMHPSIIAYIMAREAEINKNIAEKQDSILYQDFDEDNPRIVTDPRKWEIASKLLSSSNNPYSIRVAVGDNITQDFVKFCKSIQLTVEDIMDGCYNEQEYVNKSLSDKLAIISGLTYANEEQVPYVRDFISQMFGDEFVRKYDLLWIRNDPDRANFIQDLIDDPENDL